MLFSLLLLTLVLRITQNALTTKDEDDELLLSLDQEIEDLLGKEIDEIPTTFGERTSQHNGESANEKQPIEVGSPYVTGNINAIPSTKNAAEVSFATNKTLFTDKGNVNNESSLSELLSSFALHQILKRHLTQNVHSLAVYAVNEHENAFASNGTDMSSPTSGVSLASFPEVMSSVSSSALISTVSALPSSSEASSRIASASTASRRAKKPIGASYSSKTENSQSFQQSNTKCKAGASCYEDNDCGKGICRGKTTGTCDCHACISNLPCSSDAPCGGLLTSCQNGACKCAEALARHGFPLFIVALTEFCSQRTCNEDSDSCFGLPCSHGICSCQ